MKNVRRVSDGPERYFRSLGASLRQLEGHLFTGKERVDVVERFKAHLIARFDRRRTQMREQERVRQVVITFVDLRLACEDIEPGIGEPSRLQRCDHVLVVDEIAARRVDDDGALRQLFDGGLVEEVARFRRQRRIDREELRYREQAVERVVIDRAKSLLLLRRLPVDIVIMDFHFEAAGPLRQRLPNLTEAVDAELLAIETLADKLQWLPTRPRTRADHALTFRRTPRRTKKQQHGNFGRRRGNAVRRVANLDSPRLAGFEIDVVEPD